ncbi:MAG TPA: tetratricopeptide repeat protein [Acidimicrobiales bacterium]|nr:tetratricopeptide repeat protein [Acidimicrobiales bacterium]
MKETADLHSERAGVLIDQGRLHDAAGELRAGLAVEPEQPALLIERANCLVGLDELDEAQAVVGAAIRVAPGDPAAHQVHYQLLQQRADYEGAERAIVAAIELDPDDASYHSSYSWLLLEQERWDAALAEADAALALDPYDEDAPIGRVFALVSLGRGDEALTDARRKLAGNPDDAGAHAVAGLTSMATGDHQAAFESLREAQRLDPTKDWLRDFGLVGLGLSGRPLHAALIALLLDLPRGSRQAREPGLRTVLLGPLGLLGTLGRVSVRPLTTAVLRASRYGRLAASRQDTAAARVFGGVLLATLLLTLVAALASGVMAAAAFLAVGLFGLAVAGVALDAEPWGARRLAARVAAAHAAGLALWALVAAGVLAAWAARW